MTAKRIAVIPGDGVGKDVVAEGVKLLETLRDARGYALELTHYDLGADRYLSDGTTYPDDVAKAIREEHDAVLLGALGDPRVPDMGYARDILFGLRLARGISRSLRH